MRDGRREFAVWPEVFRKEVCEGFDPGSVAKWCVEEGWLLPDASDGRRQARLRIPAAGKRDPLRMYLLSDRVLGDEGVA